MQRISNNDLEFMQLLWVQQHLVRSDLATALQRAGDRLEKVRLVFREWEYESQIGKGYCAGGNGHYSIYVHDPERTLREAEPQVLALIRAVLPEYLSRRPVGMPLLRVIR